MTVSELAILLPCHSLEDFPLELTGAEAEGLLAGWSALWHPQLLAAAGKTLRWYRADYPPDDVAGRIFVIPQVSERLLLSGWVERATEQGATLIRNETDRQQIVSQALAVLENSPYVEDTELVADFLALGFANLGLELLTRQMRYISNLDEVYFENQVVAAAKAAVDHDYSGAREHLNSTFDILMDGRERFYPVDAYLLDLTLVAPTTLGAALRAELAATRPMNLLLSAATLERMAHDEPETLAVLREAVERGSVGLIGGEYEEMPLPLMSPEAIRTELVRGGEVYERILRRRPKVFGRRTAGLVSSLPQILSRLGFIGAIHATLDEGKLPRTEQSKTRWQGWDHSSIDAYARVPLDARGAGAFLSLAAKLGETMDLDHVATLAFAHWPGDASPWYDDLRRIHSYVPLFGKFVTADEFFSQTDTSGRFAKLTPDDYLTPYLSQAVRGGAIDPISTHIRREREQVLRLAESGLATIDAALTPLALDFGELGSTELAEVSRAGVGGRRPGEGDVRTNSANSIAVSIATALTRGGDASRRGVMLVNPFSFSCGAAFQSHPGAESAESQRVVEVAAMGFAWFDSAASIETAPKKKVHRPIAVERTLSNEFFELLIHPETGGIGALRNDRARGNRLSQQLALRMADGGSRSASSDNESAEYSTMRADSIDVTISDPHIGEIVSRGRLVGPGERVLARFEQTVRVVRGSRIAELGIRLETDELPQGDPWRSYYASRLAWAGDDVELRRSITGTSQPTEVRRLEAPHFVEIRGNRTRTAILTGGLPFHRRSGERMLDTLLVVSGEQEREFRVGIGVELPCAETAALVILGAEPVKIPHMPRPRGNENGWLFRLEGPHVFATHWQPIVTMAESAGDSARVTGFRVRILETEGKPGRARLHSFRPIRAARQVDLLGQPLVELRLIEEAVSLDVGAYEWLEVEVEWGEGQV